MFGLEHLSDVIVDKYDALNNTLKSILEVLRQIESKMPERDPESKKSNGLKQKPYK